MERNAGLTIIESLSIMAVCLLFLLGIFLISSKNSRGRGFAWLGWFFCLMGLNFIDGVLFMNAFYLSHIHLALWEDPFVLLYGPLIYFFAIGLKGQRIRIRWEHLIHFVPFIILEGLVLFIHLTQPIGVIKDVVSKVANFEMPQETFFYLLPIFFHLLGYTIVAKKQVSKQKSQLKQYYSSLTLAWSDQVFNFILIVFSISLINSSLQYFGGVRYFQVMLLLLMSLTVVLVARVIFVALKEPVFKVPRQDSVESRMDQSEQKALVAKISSLLSEQQVITQPDLSLSDIAAGLDESIRRVSFVINKHMADNFYDLINQYRVQLAQEIMQSSSDTKLTISEIMYQSGFNSKSSFNTQFKKLTGLTPSEYKKSL